MKQTYSEKLKDPRWQKKRLEVLQRDKFTCIICGDKETELHINHKKYTGEPWDAPIVDLETLCKHCHKLHHSLGKHNYSQMIRVIKVKNEQSATALMALLSDGYICIFPINKQGEFEEFPFKLHKNSDTIKAFIKLSKFK